MILSSTLLSSFQLIFDILNLDLFLSSNSDHFISQHLKMLIFTFISQFPIIILTLSISYF